MLPRWFIKLTVQRTSNLYFLNPNQFISHSMSRLNPLSSVAVVVIVYWTSHMFGYPICHSYAEAALMTSFVNLVGKHRTTKIHAKNAEKWQLSHKRWVNGGRLPKYKYPVQPRYGPIFR